MKLIFGRWMKEAILKGTSVSSFCIESMDEKMRRRDDGTLLLHTGGI